MNPKEQDESRKAEGRPKAAFHFIGEYLAASIRHWYWWISLIFGGCGIYFAERINHGPLPKLIVIVLVLLGVWVASFLTWLDMRKKVATLEKDLLDARQALADKPLRGIEKLDKIDYLREKGSELYIRMFMSNGVEGVEDAANWVDEVYQFGRKHLDSYQNGLLDSIEATADDGFAVDAAARENSHPKYKIMARILSARMTALLTIRENFSEP